jgi:protease I
MTVSISGARVLILVGDDYEDTELKYPKYRLAEAGADVVIAGLEAGVTHHGKHGIAERAEVAVRDLDADGFDTLVVPGGWMPDWLRRFDEVKAITKHIHDRGKIVASICHGPWIPISAGIVNGATYTSSPGLTDDLRNAGATWVDEPVVVDRNHISSRRPDDLPAFCRAIIEQITAQRTS